MTYILSFAGQTLELHGERFLWMPEHRLLCVSDLHLEKGSFFSQFATLLPPYETQDMLEQLSLITARLHPSIVIALGDSFHDAHAGTRLSDELKAKLNSIISQVPEWVWIIGNHDPNIDPSIPGERQKELNIADIMFRHELVPSETGFEISGHFHPKARVTIQGHTMKGPCFVQSGKKLILPSFGVYTGGLYIDSKDFTDHLPDPIEQVFLCYRGNAHLIR